MVKNLIKYSLSICLIVNVSACSSFNYIDTTKYEKISQERCLSKISAPSDEQRKKCIMSSYGASNFAFRMYEVRAETDYKDCEKEYESEQARDACFQEKQVAYYDAFFKVNK